jgi:glutamate N-acetyltransferase / amino-acid N-acetyltransferase
VSAGAITGPLGFRAAAVASGIKPQGLDLAVLAADAPCSAAAVFTTNRAQAAPVLVSRRHLAAGRARAVVVNAGCANAGTGEPGLEDAVETARLAASLLACAGNEVVVASTGVIGVRLPMERLRAGLQAAVPALSREGGAAAARAILTTDTRPKEALVEARLGGGSVRIGAMAKGAGMIAPRMATMLAFFTTDAAIEGALLQRALFRAVDATLNRVSVDGDTSTNDMALALASGASDAAPIEDESPEFAAFCLALTDAAREVALAIVRDGEGATRVAEVRVEGAPSAFVADRVARTVAESPLVKTALHGGDPNWGRILAAAGRAGVHLDMERIDVFLGDVWVCEDGRARAYDEAAAHRAVTRDDVLIRIALNQGTATGSIWTCDLSRSYVDINAHYRS